MVKSDVVTTPSSDDGSETNHRRHHSGFLDPIDTGTQNRTYRILGIAVQLHIGKCAYASLTEMTFSVRLYLFIPYTTTAYTYLLRSAFTTLLVFGRLFTATLIEVRPFIKINPYGNCLLNHLSAEAQPGVR